MIAIPFVFYLATLAFADKCSDIQFDEKRIASTGQKIYASKSLVHLTWVESICCCRKRGYHLVSPISVQHNHDLLNALNGVGNRDTQVGWVDVHYYNGRWKSFFSGEVPEPATYGIPQKNREGICENGDSHNGLRIVAKLEYTCNCAIYSEHLICESKDTTLDHSVISNLGSEETTKIVNRIKNPSFKQHYKNNSGDCFSTNSPILGPEKCTVENLITYARTRKCEETVVSPTKPSGNYIVDCSGNMLNVLQHNSIPTTTEEVIESTTTESTTTTEGTTTKRTTTEGTTTTKGTTSTEGTTTTKGNTTTKGSTTTEGTTEATTSTTTKATTSKGTTKATTSTTTKATTTIIMASTTQAMSSKISETKCSLRWCSSCRGCPWWTIMFG